MGRSIEWEDASKRGLVMWRVPQEIGPDDKIVVREDEMAVFYHDGRAVAYMDKPGSYDLKGPEGGAIARFLAGAATRMATVFYLQKRSMDGRFGSKQPYTFRDDEFGMVRLRLFGTFRWRIRSCDTFINRFVGTLDYHSSEQVVDRIREQLIILIFESIGLLKEKGMALADLPVNLTNIEQLVLHRTPVHFDPYGIAIEKISGLNISMPDEVQSAVDAKASMNILDIDFTTYQTGKAASEGRAQVIVADHVRVGDDITIRDSVIQRSEIGSGAGRPVVKSRTSTDESKVTVQDSVVVRSNIGPGEELETDVALRKGETGKKCPSCGEALDQGKPPKFCPNCGTRL